jgi:hypothetical protein
LHLRIDYALLIISNVVKFTRPKKQAALSGSSLAQCDEASPSRSRECRSCIVVNGSPMVRASLTPVPIPPRTSPPAWIGLCIADVSSCASQHEEAAMSLVTEAAEDLEAMARAAREAIDARLRLLAEDDGGMFWSAVAKLYARGLPEIAVAAPAGLGLITPAPDHIRPGAPPAGLAAPAP